MIGTLALGIISSVLSYTSYYIVSDDHPRATLRNVEVMESEAVSQQKYITLVYKFAHPATDSVLEGMRRAALQNYVQNHNALPLWNIKDALGFSKEGDIVYAVLNSEVAFTQVIGYTRTKPLGMSFLRGIVRKKPAHEHEELDVDTAFGMDEFMATYNKSIDGKYLEFGIEKYFALEGKGKSLEDVRNAGWISVEIGINPHSGIVRITDMSTSGTKEGVESLKSKFSTLIQEHQEKHTIQRAQAR